MIQKCVVDAANDTDAREEEDQDNENAVARKSHVS